MIEKWIDKIKEKSLKERFLLVIGILFFLIYLTLGIIVIFWEKLPLTIDKPYRIAFGVLLIVYAMIRFFRFFKENKD